MSAKTTWVLLPGNPIQLTCWSSLCDYPVGTYLFDTADSEAPWGQITMGVTLHVWHTVRVNTVPARERATALLLT